MIAEDIARYCASEILKQKQRPLLVGIMGDSGSGKSYFSDLIARELTSQGHSLTRLDHDEFLRPRSERAPLKKKVYTSGEHQGKTHWEILENWSRLVEYEHVLQDISDGKPATYYPYERSTGDISSNSKTIDPADIVLIDTSMHVNQMDFIIMIDADIDMIIRRKLTRDIDLRTPNEIIEMQRNVQSAHWHRTKPQAADIVIDNSDIRNPLVIFPLGEQRERRPLDLSRFKAVLFDLDGTIVDSMPFHLAGWLKFAKKHGVDLTGDQFVKELSGLTTPETLRRLLAREISEAEMELLKDERHNDYWEEMQHHLYAIRGFEVFLKKIQSTDIKIGLVTNGSKKSRAKMLPALGIDNAFDIIVGPEDTTKAKPDPEAFLTAMASLDVSPEECIIFEDSTHGVVAGKAAGATVVGILTTHSTDQLKAADMLINHFDELEVSLE